MSPPTSTTTVAAAPPTTKPVARPGPPPTTAPPVGGTATYSTDGGVVGVGCTSFNTIRLLAALPYDGFQAQVGNSGPYFIQVSFVGQGRTITLSVACYFGQPFVFSKTG